MKPHEYKWVKAWSRYLGSMDYFMEDQQNLAASENAPFDAIYRLADGQGWRTVGELSDAMLYKLMAIAEAEEKVT